MTDPIPPNPLNSARRSRWERVSITRVPVTAARPVLETPASFKPAWVGSSANWTAVPMPSRTVEGPSSGSTR